MNDQPVKPKPQFTFKPKPAPKSLAKPVEREQSTIGFPYNDLDTCIGIARAILNAGAVALSREQLAGLLNTSTNSGTFLNKLSATRMFGLITIAQGKIELTDLGFAILDSDDRRQKKARAEAFLSVPLFKKIYDDFRGRQLPPRPQALEQAIAKSGVATNQKGNARLTFDKSATQAGFFLNGNDRLIEPIIGGPILQPRSSMQADAEEGVDDEGAEIAGPMSPSSGTIGLHPFVRGLIEALPAPGTNWALEGRAKWLQAAANNFDLMYLGSGTISIHAKPNEP